MGFPGHLEALAAIKGMEIAEKGWLFIAEGGGQLKPGFSIQARWFPDRTSTDGAYTLHPGSGPTLLQCLPGLCIETKGAIHLWSFDQMESYFKPDAPPPESLS